MFRLNALFEQGGRLTVSERGVLDGQVPEINPHPGNNFNSFNSADKLLMLIVIFVFHVIWLTFNLYGCVERFLFPLIAKV